MNLRTQFGAAHRTILASFYRRTVPFVGVGPVVSFTFDDFPRSAYREGGSVLEANGVRGTYYASAGLMNTANDLGEQFTPEDLHSLLDHGHELASHTFGHVSCRSLASSEFRAEVERGARVLEDLTGVASMNFAYPLGHVTLKVKKAIAPLISSGRSILPGFNGPQLDLNLLRANSLYGDRDRITQAEGLINANARRKGWLIFYTHDVRPNPSRYGCTPALLQATVVAALRNGSRIMNVREVLATNQLIAAQPDEHDCLAAPA